MSAIPSNENGKIPPKINGDINAVFDGGVWAQEETDKARKSKTWEYFTELVAMRKAEGEGYRDAEEARIKATNDKLNDELRVMEKEYRSTTSICKHLRTRKTMAASVPKFRDMFLAVTDRVQQMQSDHAVATGSSPDAGELKTEHTDNKGGRSNTVLSAVESEDYMEDEASFLEELV